MSAMHNVAKSNMTTTWMTRVHACQYWLFPLEKNIAFIERTLDVTLQRITEQIKEQFDLIPRAFTFMLKALSSLGVKLRLQQCAETDHKLCELVFSLRFLLEHKERSNRMTASSQTRQFANAHEKESMTPPTFEECEFQTEDEVGFKNDTSSTTSIHRGNIVCI